LTNHLLLENTAAVTRALVLNICIFIRFKLICEFMPLRCFTNSKLVTSRHRTELRGPKAMAYLAYA